MKIKLRHAWASLRATYWFLPALMAAAAGVLALICVQVDRSLMTRYVAELAWIYTPEPRDRADLERRYAEVLQLCGESEAG